MSTGLPTYQEPLLEIINGKPTGRMNWRWYQYFQEREPQITEENIETPALAAAARAANAQAQAEFATMHRPPRQFVEVLESALMMQRPRQPLNNFTFLADTAANLTNYTASAYPSAIYFETDTFVTRWSDGSAWTEFIFPALVKFLGSTSSFPALKRSSAILQVRLADDSAYTDLEVLDEAYDPTNWNGSVEVPTKNAVRDKIETVTGGATGALVSDDAYGAGWNGVTLVAPSKNAVYDKIETLLGSSAYTPTNVTTDRSYDANATTIDEIADVLGTVIADLQTKGILS